MRAQTTLDFAIGMSVFLLATTFVLGFVPGMLQPFSEGTQEETVAADRVASQLAQGSLAHPDEPYLLDTECTVEFFRTDPTGSPDCAFDQSTSLDDENGLTDRIGLAPRQRINVTIRGDIDSDGTAETLCWDGTNVRETSSCSSTDVVFDAGETPPGAASSVAARRTVGVEGHDATLTVRMW